MNTLNRTVSFLDKNNHRAIIEVEITTRNGYHEFSASGQHMDSMGQCLDRIKPKGINQVVLVKLWKEYHLKDITNVKNFYTLLVDTLDKIELEEGLKEIPDTIEQKMEEWFIYEDLKGACIAYLEVMGIDDLKDFEEVYQGEYDSDEIFAEELAGELGSMDDYVSWPNNCIDWEMAAKDLMMDYVEQDGFYFRNV